MMEDIKEKVRKGAGRMGLAGLMALSGCVAGDGTINQVANGIFGPVGEQHVVLDMSERQEIDRKPHVIVDMSERQQVNPPHLNRIRRIIENDGVYIGKMICSNGAKFFDMYRDTVLDTDLFYINDNFCIIYRPVINGGETKLVIEKNDNEIFKSAANNINFERYCFLSFRMEPTDEGKLNIKLFRVRDSLPYATKELNVIKKP